MNTTTQFVNSIELEKKVKHVYRMVAQNPLDEYHFEMGRSLAERLGYDSSRLDSIPSAAIQSFAGVGYFFDMANIQRGQFIVDLGSGSGMDVLYAADQVGSEGEVIGIDMTIAQLEKSRSLTRNASNIYFHEGRIEQPPIVSNSIDTVISNGVINLSGEKQRVFNEVARILKPGGKMAIADIVTNRKLPESISCNASLWAACIGGAVEKESYFQLINNAGLDIVDVKKNPYAFLSKGAKGATRDYGIESLSILAIKK